MDATDTRLVAALQDDGRMPLTALARASGTSRTAAALRVKHLIGSGSIQIVTARHRSAHTHTWAAHVCIKTTGDIRTTATRLATMPETSFVSITTGDAGIVAEVVAEDFAGLVERVNSVRCLAGVHSASSTLYWRVLRDLLAPTGKPAFDPDAVDLRLIGLLERDGRCSYAALGKSLGLSPNATRVRLLRLVDGHVIRVGALIRRRAADQDFSIGIGICTHGDDTAVLEAINQLGPGELEFVARGIGRFDLVMTARVANRSHGSRIVETLRNTTGVAELDSWLHLDVIKDLFNHNPDVGVAH